MILTFTGIFTFLVCRLRVFTSRDCTRLTIDRLTPILVLLPRPWLLMAS